MDNDDFLEDPDAPFEIDKEVEDEFKLLIYEMAVRNLIVTFDPKCMSKETEEEWNEQKDILLNKLFAEAGDFKYYTEVPDDIYNVKKAFAAFDDCVKRNENGNYFASNTDLLNATSQISIELYENKCMREVEKGNLELVFDSSINDFVFRDPVKKENAINKSNKPRRTGRKKK
jgi:hypothetical protein